MSDYSFSPHGYTCVWLIGESHIAVHTWPEHGVAYLECSSCNQDKHDRFSRLIDRWTRVLEASHDARFEPMEV